jgi:predicted amidohydrolase
MEHNVVVSVYQGTCAEGDFAANLAVVRKVVGKAKSRGSHFVCFPECFLSGYESREAVRKGARGLDDPDLAAFIAESARHDMVVLVGLARKAPDGLYNSVLVIYRGKLMGWYDKVMLTDGDSRRLGFKPGTSVPVFQAHDVRFAVQICHDSSFPHVALHARLQGALLLFSPHNNEIEASAADDHRKWVRNNHVGTACQMKMAVARANVVKSDRSGQIGYGDSFILSPQGTPLAEAKLFRNELITATITPAMFRGPWVWADFAEAPAWLRTQTADLLTDFRRPRDDADLAYWLENMAVYHGFSRQEMSAATGLTLEEIDAAIQRLGVAGMTIPTRKPDDPLKVLPYPGARHPRIGFFEGALMPQRETKVSVFAPWVGGGYVVVDVPEAVWSNLGLIYLAHTHVLSIWDQAGFKLPRLEWTRNADGTLEMSRTLPNGIAFGTKVTPSSTDVRFNMWLRNGTKEQLTGLRIQNCVMLAGAAGFAAQTNDNKLFRPPFAAARSEDGRRWIITCFEPAQRCWGNEKCPCLHSDPRFPDCDPGQTVRVRGRVWFYEGTHIEEELRRVGVAHD